MIANLLKKHIRKCKHFVQKYHWHIVISSLIFISLATGIFYLVFQSRDRQYTSRIYPNVYIDGVNVGGYTKEKAKDAFVKKNLFLDNVKLNVLYKDEQIATMSADQLALASNGEEIVDRAYLIGRSTHTPTKWKQRFLTLFTKKQYHFYTSINYNRGDINDFIKGIELSYNKPARNALFQFENGKVTSFKPDEKGLKINADKMRDDFDHALQEMKTKPGSKTIVILDTILEADITLAEANSFGIEEEIAVGKSDYTHSIPSRVHNVLLAASKFHGVLMPKGKVFSFGDTIGDIDASHGYQPAYVIKEGKTVLGDGGGICQVSTTLFRAALNAGLPIEERHAHAYRVGYYENDSKPGMDATIFAPTVDLKIKNDTPSDILIQTEVDQENNLLTFHLYGKKDGRKVEISPIKVWDISGAPPAVMQDDPTLKKGVVRQVDFPAGGAKASFTYKVQKPNAEVTETTFLSVYRPWAAVFLVGTAE